MILNFMTTFPAKVPGIGGTPTEFRGKIRCCATVKTEPHHYSVDEMNAKIWDGPGRALPPKLHTIRLPRKGEKQWDKDVPIHFAQGGYRKGVLRIFAEGVCTSVQPIKIDFAYGCSVHVKREDVWHQLLNTDVERLAKNDGFRNADEFYKYFRWACDGTQFIGRLIHWTPLTY